MPADLKYPVLLTVLLAVLLVFSEACYCFSPAIERFSFASSSGMTTLWRESSLVP